MQRRDFLLTTTSLAAGGVLTSSWKGLRGDETTPPRIDTPRGQKAKVGIGGSSMADAVNKAVELSGGIDFIKEGQTVLIKPNVTGALVNPTTTDPEVLYAVIKLVNTRGPRRILVSDRCFSPLFSEATPKTVDVMKAVGHLEAVEQAKIGHEGARHCDRLRGGGTRVCGSRNRSENSSMAKDETRTRHPLVYRLRIGRITLRRRSRGERPGHQDSLPSLVHHGDESVCGNVTPPNQDDLPPRICRRAKSDRSVGSRVPGTEEFATPPWNQKRSRRGRKPNLSIRRQDCRVESRSASPLNILDGTKSFVFGGPSHGDEATAKVIVASRDRVAADVVGVAVLKYLGCEDRMMTRSIWQIPFVRHAVKIGLGIQSADEISLNASDVPFLKELEGFLAS